jgi:hypothetical protein
MEDICEESDSFPAELSLDDLETSQFFSRISGSGSHPLLSSRATTRLIDYLTRLKGKRRENSPEWDLDAFARILRLLERSMRDGGEISVFDEPKRLDNKKTKGKKSSKSPDLTSQEPSAEGDVDLSEDMVKGLEDDLKRLASAGLAASATLILFDLEGLPKQASRDTI